MTRPALWTGATVLLIAVAVSALVAQQAPAPAGPQPYFVGNRLGLPINPAPDGAFNPMSSNVKVYGANQLVIPMNANNAMAFIPLK